MKYTAPNNFGKTKIPTIVKALAIAVVFVFAGFVLSNVGTAGPANLGTGRVTSVISTGSSCADGPNGDHVQSWEVAAGGTYEVTISDVTECSGSSIGVIVLSSATGNQALTATSTGDPGDYKFTVTLPAGACATMPIKYCTVGGSPSTGKFARRNDGGSFEAHLRTSTFDGECNAVAPVECGFQPPQGAISACKFYDANTNGINDGELPLAGWPMTISPLDGAIPQEATQLTGPLPSGCATWSGLDIGLNPYAVSEGTPAEPNWLHTTAASVNINVVVDQTVSTSFGNVCTGAGGGLTLGFWSNKNGEKAILNCGSLGGTAGTLAYLSSKHLRNANGSNFDPGTYSAFRTWLLGATAQNMAYMLSAQFAAMELNTHCGGVNGNSLIYAPGTTSANAAGFATVNAVLAEAELSLTNFWSTPSGNGERAHQEALKNALDNANNNLNFVQAQPCAYTF